MVSISDPITEIYVHGIVIHLSCLCFVFVERPRPKNCFFSKGTGLFKKRGSAEKALISDVTQENQGMLNS